MESILPPKCSKCGKPAAITLRYMNSDFCQSDFTRFFEARFKRAVREFRMLKSGERVAVGLSGGKDSCVMLHLLHKLSQSLPIRLFAITIDEGIEGYRNHTLEVAKKECKKLGVPLRVISFRKEFDSTLDALLEKKGESRSCSYCGVMRRYLLNKFAREMKADKIAIGHNSDDVAQTVMMNLMRNEPVRLARFGPVSGIVDDELFIPRIKPLFMTPERDVAAYAMMKGIEIDFQECPYARHAFRQHVRVMLNEAEAAYPGTKLRIVRAHLTQNELLAEGAKHNLAAKGGNKIGKCGICSEPSSQEVCNLCLMLERSQA